MSAKRGRRLMSAKERDWRMVRSAPPDISQVRQPQELYAVLLELAILLLPEPWQRRVLRRLCSIKRI